MVIRIASDHIGHIMHFSSQDYERKRRGELLSLLVSFLYILGCTPSHKMARPCFLDFLAYRELGESRGNLHHWTSEEWARWECVVKAEYAPLSSEAAPLIRVNPTLVLFTQGEISSTFGEGSHQGRPIYVMFKFLWAPFCPYTEASVNIVG